MLPYKDKWYRLANYKGEKVTTNNIFKQLLQLKHGYTPTDIDMVKILQRYTWMDVDLLWDLTDLVDIYKEKEGKTLIPVSILDGIAVTKQLLEDNTYLFERMQRLKTFTMRPPTTVGLVDESVVIRYNYACFASKRILKALTESELKVCQKSVNYSNRYRYR
jgi:hypothetical protein